MLRPYLWVVCKAAARHPAVLDERPPAERRARAAARKRVVPPPDDGLIVEDLEVPVPGSAIPVRSYRPAASAVLPVHLYAHGGSFWSGDIDQVDPMARRYARTAGCRVLSIGYRLAPEHQWPTGVEDYYAVLEWTAAHAGELNVDPSRISVGGGSCGGNFAAIVAQLARERGGPRIMFQLLEIPSMDGTFSYPSMTTLGTGYLVTKADLQHGWSYYVPAGVDRTDPHISPIFAKDLSGLPPALILTCEYDPLRDEGEAYANRLRAAGVPVQLIRANGHIHSSTYSRSRFLPSAGRYQRITAEALRQAYAGG